MQTVLPRPMWRRGEGREVPLTNTNKYISNVKTRTRGEMRGGEGIINTYQRRREEDKLSSYLQTSTSGYVRLKGYKCERRVNFGSKYAMTFINHKASYMNCGMYEYTHTHAHNTKASLKTSIKSAFNLCRKGTACHAVPDE